MAGQRGGENKGGLPGEGFHHQGQGKHCARQRHIAVKKEKCIDS